MRRQPQTLESRAQGRWAWFQSWSTSPRGPEDESWSYPPFSYRRLGGISTKVQYLGTWKNLPGYRALTISISGFPRMVKPWSALLMSRTLFHSAAVRSSAFLFNLVNHTLTEVMDTPR